MSNIKLVLTDMDGTILPMGKEMVTDAVKRSVKEVQDAGIVVAAVTGRPYHDAKSVIDELNIEGLCVFSGGATVLDTRTGEIVWKQWIAKEYLWTIIASVKPYCIELAWNQSHDMHVANTVDVSEVNEDSQYLFGIYEESQLATLKEIVGSLPDIDFHFFEGYDPRTRKPMPAFQINHKLATKHHGVEALRMLEHTPIENTLAIGDGDNDIALFKSAGVKVAMGNASERLIAVADYTVATVDEDGFVEAMQKHVLTN
jgi:HAD superfamily hydrolase (TIGR01484 family)